MTTPSSHVLAPLFALAEQAPDRVILTLVDERGHDAEVRTAAQLAARTVRLAAYLQEVCGLRPGDVALLVYPPSMEFVECFAACLWAGIIPAPVYPPHPTHPDKNAAVLRMVAAHTGAKALLTSRTYRWATRLGAAQSALRRTGSPWPALPWHVTQGLTWFAPRATPTPVPHPHDLALLQFTSGSTSVPKGVRLTHKNLIHQLTFNADVLRMGPDARFVAWVPQYHDLGLISGLLSVLRGNGCLWFMSPQSFLASPALWPETMHRVRATHTASPNFGFELVTRRTTPEQRARWDLRSLQVVMSAAEPVMPGTVDRFLSAFAPCGLLPGAFSPAYGLAEHTVGVTLGGRDRLRVDRVALTRDRRAEIDESSDLELVGCGRPSHGIALRIVDPLSCLPLPDRSIGEIWVQSDSVADGYERSPDATAAAFAATLPGEAGTWLRTGDLGFLHRGELYVTGRHKDLIIVRGRNFYPEDIEETVRFCHPEIRPGGVVAFAIPGDATESLMILAELKTPDLASIDEVIAAIEAKLRDTWQLDARIALLPPASIKKTTSGKLQRSACRTAWLDGSLTPLKVTQPRALPSSLDNPGLSLRAQLQDVDEAERLGWLTQVGALMLRRELPIDPLVIDPDAPLWTLGMDSLASARFLAQLEARLSQQLSAALLIEHPTLRSASARILQEIGLPYRGDAPPDAPLVPLPFRPPHRPMPPATTRVAIIGGGVGGLVSALELVRLGYRNVVIFESAAQCGGKVYTGRVGDAHFELGQVVIADSYRVVLEIAAELGLTFRPSAGRRQHWEAEEGLAEAPAPGPAVRWIRSVLQAARVKEATDLPFPCVLDLDESFAAFLARHKLRAPPPWFTYLWNGMGYGCNHDLPASYVIAYLQIIGVTSNFAHLPEGNQELWVQLAATLERDWGVTIRRSTHVTAVVGDETGVTVHVADQAQRFDEVILAAPPQALTALLPPHDPLQPLLASVQSNRYSTLSFQARFSSDVGLVFFPQSASVTQQTLLLAETPTHPGWYVSARFEAPDGPLPVPEQDLYAELHQTVHTLGGQVTAHGPYRTWTYFPCIRHNPTAALRQVEALQGTRHLWTTGSWVSFETIEHVARHARHLVQTCFDPDAPQDQD